MGFMGLNGDGVRSTQFLAPLMAKVFSRALISLPFLVSVVPFFSFLFHILSFFTSSA